jgi:hypothetical protein
MIAAFGITLAASGLVTDVFVSVVGVIAMLAGAIGWFRDVLPVEDRVPVEIEPEVPVVMVRSEVTHLEVGEAGHRARLPIEIYPYSAGVKGGIVGGIAMAILAVLYGVLFYGSIWYPINLLAAGTMASLANADTATLTHFNGAALGVATGIHAVMSILVGLLYGVLLPMWPKRPILFGGVVVPVLWTALIWASLRVVNPTLNARIDWGWFVASQIAFGVAAGLVVSRSAKIATLQSESFLVRAGVEFSRGKDGLA